MPSSSYSMIQCKKLMLTSKQQIEGTAHDYAAWNSILIGLNIHFSYTDRHIHIDDRIA